jgi:hypothetical protein
VATHVGITCLATLAVIAVLPPLAAAQLTCHTEVGITTSPGGSMAIGDTRTVTLALGASGVRGGSRVTIKRVRYDLDCNANFPLRLPCTDQGDVFTYLGDATIVTDCPTYWTSNAPAGGNVPNEIVFTASPPVDIFAYQTPSCTLSFAVGLNNAQPTSGSRSDPLSLLSEVVAGFSNVSADAVCDNGLVSAGTEAVAIPLLVPAPMLTPHRRMRY